MIRQGKLCRECTGSKCKDVGTEAEPTEIECPLCGGGGCDQCSDGWFVVDGCPNKFCSDMAYLPQFIDLFQKGLPPVAGGSLDQSQSFLDAAEQLSNDETKLKNSKA